MVLTRFSHYSLNQRIPKRFVRLYMSVSTVARSFHRQTQRHIRIQCSIVYGMRRDACNRARKRASRFFYVIFFLNFAHEDSSENNERETIARCGGRGTREIYPPRAHSSIISTLKRSYFFSLFLRLPLKCLIFILWWLEQLQPESDQGKMKNMMNEKRFENEGGGMRGQ